MAPTILNPECDALRDDLASLAIGALTGVDRARVLLHLEGCSPCTAELEELSAAADALTSLVPEATPPAGFADRTMDLIRVERAVPRRPARRRLATVAALILLLAAGVGMGVALSSHGTPAPASAVRTAQLHSSVGTSGTVLLVTKGHEGWLVMSLHDAPTTGTVTCSITLDDGSRKDLGQFRLRYGYGSWSVALPVAAGTVRTVSVVDGTGATVASAQPR